MTQDIYNEGCRFFNDLILNELLPVTENGCYIGGGAVRNWFAGIRNIKEFSDVDIWVKNERALQEIMLFFDSKGAVLTHNNDKAKMYYWKNIYWDIHHQFFCDPVFAMQFVDITVNACFCDGLKFYYPKDYFLHLATKEIVWHSFNGYGIELLTQRIQKMVNKGFHLSWKESKRIDSEMTKFLINRNKEVG